MYPEAVILETISPDLATSAGTGLQFRLDLPEVRPAASPTIVSGRASVPNKVSPPTVPVVRSRKAPPTKLVPPSTQQPDVTGYLHSVVLSSRGSQTSYWQVLSIGLALANPEYLLFNPASGCFLGHAPTVSPSSGTSLVDHTGPNGSPIIVADAKRYLSDLTIWLKQDKTANIKNILATTTDQLQSFVWKFQRADFGPVPGMGSHWK